MKKEFFAESVVFAIPACAFAVDGVTLINQSTVMPAGGFPYVIYYCSRTFDFGTRRHRAVWHGGNSAQPSP